MALIRLDQLLGSASRQGLDDLVRQAREMHGLTERLRSVLPADIRPHLVAANLREGSELVLLCRSPAWAARLRYERDALLEAARGAGADVSRVSVRVAR